MKQYIIFTLFVTMFLFSFSFAQAQTDVRKASPSLIRENADIKRTETKNIRSLEEDKRTDINKKTEEAKERLVEKKEERKQKLNEQAKERISAYVKRIIKRLNVALDRLEKIAERVESRIEKLEEKFADRDLDLSEAKRLLGIVDIEIAKAREDIFSIEGSLGEALNADNPRESFAKVRELIKTATDSVKSAHKALVEAIKSVKVEVADDENTKVEDDQ